MTKRVKRIYVDVPESMAKEFKKRTIDYDIAMSKVLLAAINKYMTDHPKKVESTKID